MNSPFERSGLLAFGPRGDRSSADLWSAASRIARVLPHERRGASVLLVFESDRFLLLAAMLAAWSRGLVALIPPDNRRATLTRLQHLDEVVAILHDTESGLEHRVHDVLREPESLPDLDAFLEVLDGHWQAPEAPLLSILGSMGSFQLSGQSIEAEIARLDALVPLPPAARVAASVSPGHRYGLVHTILRPFLNGGAFYRSLGPSSALSEESNRRNEGLVEDLCVSVWALT